jgi:hypothetical protein
LFDSLEMLYPFVFTHVFIPKPVPTFGRHALDGEQIGHEDDSSETNDCPERNAPAGFLNGFVHGDFGNLVVQLFYTASFTTLLPII